MTRLEVFAARMTREMLDEYHATLVNPFGAVEKVAASLIREFVHDHFVPPVARNMFDRKEVDEVLDEPAHNACPRCNWHHPAGPCHNPTTAP